MNHPKLRRSFFVAWGTFCLMALFASSSYALGVTSSLEGKDVSSSSYTGGVVRVKSPVYPQSSWVADFHGQNIYDASFGGFPMPMTAFIYHSVGYCNVVDINLGNGCGFKQAQVTGGNSGNNPFEIANNPYNDELNLVYYNSFNTWPQTTVTKDIYSQAFAHGAACYDYDTNAWQGTGADHQWEADPAFVTVDFLC